MKVRGSIVAVVLSAGALFTIPDAALADQTQDDKWRCTIDGNCADAAATVEEEGSAVGEGLAGVEGRPVIDVTKLLAEKPTAGPVTSRPRTGVGSNALSRGAKQTAPVGRRGARSNAAAAAAAATTASGARAQAYSAPAEVTRKSDLFVTFRRNSAELDGGVTSDMRSLAKVVRESLAAGNKRVIEIGGHTDATGGDDFNLALSQARAETVRKSLIDLGVPAEAVKAVGYGETKLIEGYAPEHGINRRVEVSVVN